MERLARVIFKARGHPNVKATHPSTLEITKDDFLTPRGDCIIAIKSDLACKDLPEDVKSLLRNDNSLVRIKLFCEDLYDEILAKGSSKLSLKSSRSMVIRRSDFICDRTVAILANKSAKDINRELIRKLKNGNELCIEFEVYCYEK